MDHSPNKDSVDERKERGRHQSYPIHPACFGCGRGKLLSILRSFKILEQQKQKRKKGVKAITCATAVSTSLEAWKHKGILTRQEDTKLASRQTAKSTCARLTFIILLMPGSSHS